MDQELHHRNDPLLMPFLEAAEETAAEDLLTRLISEHADPIILRVLRMKLHVSLRGANGTQANQDALEIAAELRLNLVKELKAIQQGAGKQITSFHDYVAVKAYSACSDYFREKNPRRSRLKNALRYQLRNNPRFALWRAGDNRWYAGLQEWHASVIVAGGEDLPESSSVDSRDDDSNAADLLASIFEHSGKPVEFDQLVTIAADEMGIVDALPQSLDSGNEETQPYEPSTAPRVDVRFEQRLFLEQLWHEVCELPLLQRVALLLNLRDENGGSAIFFLPHLGIAPIEEIASAIEIPPERFKALWSDLPIDDAQIASMFDITRQQVINLRKTARERLRRRLGP